jgi:hypothetical protein
MILALMEMELLCKKKNSFIVIFKWDIFVKF